MRLIHYIIGLTSRRYRRHYWKTHGNRWLWSLARARELPLNRNGNPKMPKLYGAITGEYRVTAKYGRK